MLAAGSTEMPRLISPLSGPKVVVVVVDAAAAAVATAGSPDVSESAMASTSPRGGGLGPGRLILKMAEGFSLPIAPRNLNSVEPGSWMWTPAAVLGGNVLPGRMKTTRWEKWGLDGKENANWVGEMVMKFVRQGLLAGMTLNMTAAATLERVMYARQTAHAQWLLCGVDRFVFTNRHGTMVEANGAE